MTANKTPEHPLQLSGAEMRALGARAMEMVVRHFENNRDEPVACTLPRATTELLLRTPLSEHGTPVNELLDIVARDVFLVAQDRPSPVLFVRAESDELCERGGRPTHQRTQRICRPLDGSIVRGASRTYRARLAQGAHRIPGRRRRHLRERRLDGEPVCHCRRARRPAGRPGG